MKALQPGTTLQNGKYKIVQTLGQGSFGITYLATTVIPVQGAIGTMNVEIKVAIKEFFMSDLSSRSADGTSLEKTDSTLVKKYAKKFHSEAENLAKLQHPNIVRVLEVFDENNTSYYVMEYIEGETLDDYIKRSGTIGEEEARLITLDICSALRHMHDHHMLHLDLKPKNVMRDHNGKVYLIDFGLAKQYNENGEPESSTTLGLGTRGYAPVEQMKYKSDGTMPATLDIYALGATLFKMLTGQIPPESSDVLNDGLPVALLQKVGVSDAMIATVEKAMAPMKKNRYQQVGELMDALTIKDNLTEETVVEQQKEETVVQNEETKYVTPPYQEEVPPSYNPETPPPGYYNETPSPAYNNETPPYNPWEQPYDEESPSFLQKYWKYGLLALIPLLILGGVLLFSGSKDDEETRDHDVIAANMEEDGEVTDDVEEPAPEVTDEDQKDAGEAVKEAEEKAREAQEKAKEAAKKAAEDAQSTTPVEPAKPVVEEKKPEPPKPVEDNNVYSVVESLPSFPGGNAAMRQWMSQNLKYPPVAQENGIQGTVTVQFVVEKNGSISNVKVIRGKDPSLDREAVRVVSSMPRWTPGKQNGKPVRVSYTVPVKFALQ